MNGGLVMGTVLAPRTFGPINAAWVRRYVDAASDPNPLHRDPAAARAAGFAGPILPGMLLLGLCERAMTGWADLPITHLSGRFLAPLAAPVTVAVSGRVVAADGQRRVVRLFVRPANEPHIAACVAEAWLSAPSGT